jgi:hypothetical protein
LNLVCHAFASVRTSVPMRVGIELFVSGHSTVKQPALRLNLFFKAGTSTSAISQAPGAASAQYRRAASDPIHRIGRLLNTLTPHPFLCRNPHAPSAETGWDGIGNLGLMASRPGQPVFNSATSDGSRDRLETLEEARRNCLKELPGIGGSEPFSLTLAPPRQRLFRDPVQGNHCELRTPFEALTRRS